MLNTTTAPPRHPTPIATSSAAAVLAEFIGAPGLSDVEKAKLVAIYSPYLIMPLLMLWRAASRSGGMFATSAGAAAAASHGGAKDGGRYYGNKDV
jgi:hypothetical protein